jgi:Alginate lyase/Concanavalin A-like lectin/glucanases superfamily
VTAGDRYLISQSDVSPNRNALSIFFANGGGLMLRMGNTTIPAPILSTAEITAYPNAWYYLAVTWDEARDAGEVKWYLGRVGSQLNSGTFDFANDGVVGNDGTIYVGNHSSLTSGFRNPGDGALDQVAFWNRELLAGQIAAQFILLPHGPSANLDLASWNLMLPVDSAGGSSGAPRVVPTGWLNSGFQYVDPNDPNGCKKKHFYRDTDGTVAIMVFEAPWNGADTDSTGNSPRSELRQTYADGSEHNWTPSAEGGTHSLQASCAVNSGDSKVIIGQIHAETPIPPGGSTGVPAIVLDYTAGAIRLTVKRSPNDRINDTTYDFPGPFALGAQINYTLQLVGTGTSVKLYATVNGQKPRLNGVPQDFVDMYATDPAWADVNTTLYFKAGSYYPDNVGTGTAKVTFSSLSVTPATP